ncbi:MAG: carbamoyl phosphate synthase large subunit, partial [Bifidobacteriales bacterium]|nr:carbamoyl phosphate synthase large subunit [Bifidobacteriales bacterium]
MAKATGVPVAKIGARIMAGAKLADFPLEGRSVAPHVAVKEAVFPFSRFSGVDTILGPEMRSTGEVMGLDANFEMAFAKAQLAAGVNLPREGAVFLSVRESDKAHVQPLARKLVEMGFTILATRGTADRLKEAGIPVTQVN